MKLSHKKVFDTLCKKYQLTYRKGQGGYEPTNYHFLESEKWSITIERIPEGKFLKTLYVMTNGLENPPDSIYDDIKNLYTSQREGQPCEWHMSFNTAHASIIF